MRVEKSTNDDQSKMSLDRLIKNNADWCRTLRDLHLNGMMKPFFFPFQSLFYCSEADWSSILIDEIIEKWLTKILNAVNRSYFDSFTNTDSSLFSKFSIKCRRAIMLFTFARYFATKHQQTTYSSEYLSIRSIWLWREFSKNPRRLICINRFHYIPLISWRDHRNSDHIVMTALKYEKKNDYFDILNYSFHLFVWSSSSVCISAHELLESLDQLY